MTETTNDQMDTVHHVAIQAVQEWGADRQIDKCMEELGELVQALAKWKHNPELEEIVVSEVADVSFCLTQMVSLFKNPKSFRETLMYKVDRTSRLIKERRLNVGVSRDQTASELQLHREFF